MEKVIIAGTGSAATVGATSTLILAENRDRNFVVITNDSNEDMYINIGAAAVMNSGIRLGANGGMWSETMEQIQVVGGVYAICASGGKNVCIFEA